MVYIKNLLPRDDILIDNLFEIINDTNDDFHIVLYYIDCHKIKIVIRRLDSDCGWCVNLKIKLWDIKKENFEIISFGSSENNFKILNIYTKIKLDKPIYEELQKIPKLIFQTTFKKDISDTLHYNSILTYIELNPEYEYKLFDDYECRNFIKNFFDKNILDAYDLLIPGAFKADLFRYCYLYINGGCYFDCKSILKMPLRKIINKDDDLLLCKDIGKGYYNAVMLSIKGNDIMLKVINICVYNIINFYKIYDINHKLFHHGDSILSLTGPILLYNVTNNLIDKNKSLKFIHKNKNNFIHNYQKLCVEYNNEIIITKQYSGYKPNGIHYSNLWFQREIIYIKCNNQNQYNFYSYINDIDMRFNLYIYNKKLIIIERIDKDSGWNNNLKLKIIDENYNREIKVDIGNSNIKYKLHYFMNDMFDCEYIISSFHNINIESNDIFNVNIVQFNDIYKIIIIKGNSEKQNKIIGWDEDLKLNILLNNSIIDDRKYIFTVGKSLNNIIIKDFTLIYE
jgi:mannosyltransferase OCH1-like enzyme